MEGVFVVAIMFFIFVLPPAVFWGLQLADLMGRRDNEFPGKYDKLSWALVIVFGTLLGAFVYFCCKPRSSSARRKYHSLIEGNEPRFGAVKEDSPTAPADDAIAESVVPADPPDPTESP